MSRKLTIIACSIVALVGCREDPGDPNYPVYEAVGATDPDFLPGPFPFQEGDERLSVGVFYEGGASEVIEIDNVSNNYFIYEGTYEQFPSEDRVEGLVSEQLVDDQRAAVVRRRRELGRGPGPVGMDHAAGLAQGHRPSVRTP